MSVEIHIEWEGETHLVGRLYTAERSAAVMNTRIFLIRHGATTLSAEDRFAGATDVPLSDEGRQQVCRLAARLSEEKITAVYASPLGRTIETARILAEPHTLEVETREGLQEISHGHWEQKTRREVEEQFPEEAAAWDADPYTFAPVGGESGLAVTARPQARALEAERKATANADAERTERRADHLLD